MSRYAAHDRQRWAPEESSRPSGRDDFARDRARVVHSSALRRLSAKTQVVQPDSDDFVRNRLTHSLEVAQIGREFGASLGCDPDVVDTACLAHDLGHPPFGHNGEQALAEVAAAIGGFEGNAQTLRLLTRLEAKRALPDGRSPDGRSPDGRSPDGRSPDGRSAGLNLTRASLDATVKYPWLRGDGPELARGGGKFGAYADDQDAFAWVRDAAPRGRPCLEAQVMDWSDDVAYSVHDVEDAIVLQRCDPRVLRSPGEADLVIRRAAQLYAPGLEQDVLAAAWDRLLAPDWLPQAYDGTRSGLAALKDLTSRLIGRFVGAVERATRARHGPGALVRYDADLVIPDGVRAECAVLKAVAAHYVMYVDERLTVMAAQRDVVRELVQALLDKPHDRLDAAYLGDFEQAADDAGRLRCVVDQVASWTDLRAVALHRRWC